MILSERANERQMKSTSDPFIYNMGQGWPSKTHEKP